MQMDLDLQIPKDEGQKSYSSEQHVLPVLHALPKSMLVARVPCSLSYVYSARQGLTSPLKQCCPAPSTCSFRFLERIALYASFMA